MDRVTRLLAREYLALTKAGERRVPFWVVRALTPEGFLATIDEYALYLWRRYPRYWVALARLWFWRSPLSQPVHYAAAVVDVARIIPVARRVAAREGIPYHQVMLGAVSQTKWLQDHNNIDVEPQALIRMYAMGRSVASVNQLLRAMTKDATPLTDFASEVAFVFGDTAKITYNNIPTPTREVR